MPFIRLNDHSVHFICSVAKLYEKMELTDCVMVTRGGSIHAHKIILAAHSPYVKKLLMNDGGMTSFAFKEVENNIMKLILDMMYYGQADVPDTDVALFTETANLLQITSLRRASPNLSETFFMRNTSEGDNAPTRGVNLTKNNERNLPVLENEVMSNQHVLHEREGRSNSGFENIDLQSIHCPETEENFFLKDISGKVNVDHSKVRISNSSETTNYMQCTDGEDLQDELNPISFVVVPSVFVNSEEVEDEQSSSCICDLQLKNHLSDPVNCKRCNKGNFKEEQEFLSVLQIKIENKEVIVNNEDIKDFVPFSHKVKQSTTVVDNVLTDSEPMDSAHSFSGLNDGCVGEGAEDLKVKFESIYDEEKPFVNCLDIGNTEELEPLFLKEEHETLNVGEEELSLIGCQQDMNQGRARTSQFKMKETTAVLNRIKQLDTEVTDKDNSDDNLCSSVMREPPENEKEFNIFEDKEMSSSGECVAVNSSGNNCKIKNHSSGRKQFSCNICEVIFDECRNLQQHSLIHVNDQLKKISCCTCGKFFTKKETFEEHTCSRSMKQSHQCGILCSKSSFISKGNLQSHMRNLSDNKRFLCDVCEASFTRKSNLTDHMRLHSSVKPYSCDVCQTPFFKNSYLKRHMRTHSGEKPFSCDDCKRSFAIKSDLQRHLLTHAGMKPFSCDVCKKSFFGKYELRRHMRTHSGEKPFSCVFCKASFAWKRRLTVHMLSHSGVKPFTCDFCKRSFFERNVLKTHMRTHTGEKPFLCEVCERSFSHKSSLKRHSLTHT